MKMTFDELKEAIKQCDIKIKDLVAATKGKANILSKERHSLIIELQKAANNREYGDRCCENCMFKLDVVFENDAYFFCTHNNPYLMNNSKKREIHLGSHICDKHKYRDTVLQGDEFGTLYEDTLWV